MPFPIYDPSYNIACAEIQRTIRPSPKAERIVFPEDGVTVMTSTGKFTSECLLHLTRYHFAFYFNLCIKHNLNTEFNMMILFG